MGQTANINIKAQSRALITLLGMRNDDVPMDYTCLFAATKLCFKNYKGGLLGLQYRSLSPIFPCLCKKKLCLINS